MKRNKFSPPPDESITHDANQKFGLPDITIPAEVLFNPNLSLTQKVLFGFIRNLAQTEKGCWASNRYLSKCIGMAKQTVSDSVSKLKELHYIRVQFRTLSNGNQGRVIFIDERYPLIYSAYIRQVFKNINNGIVTRTYTPRLMNLPPYKDEPRNTYNKINIKNITYDDGDLRNASNGYITAKDFHEFWELYPPSRRGSKGEALTKWETTCRSTHRPTLNKIKRAIAKQKQTPRWQDPQFIPLATTWIHQKRWLDDPALMINFENGTPSIQKDRIDKEANEKEMMRNLGYTKEIEDDDED